MSGAPLPNPLPALGAERGGERLAVGVRALVAWALALWAPVALAVGGWLWACR